MSEPTSAANTAEPQPQKSPDERATIPSWAISVALHAVLVIVLGLTIKLTPQGSAAENSRETGIVLAYTDPAGEVQYFQDGSESSDGNSESQTDSKNQSQATQTSLSQTSLANVSDALPEKSNPVVGVGRQSQGSLVGDAASLIGGARPRGAKGGQATTRVFGIEGTGSKFCYVFDRSGSMGGSGRNALRAAQAELIASLASLGETQQFEIIFYNQKPKIFNPGGKGHLSWATEQNKELARRFVLGITADGSTRHEEAIDAALSRQPDVIFFLTDADQPRLSAGQLADIRRRNGGRTSINTIEFGIGPPVSRDNFISRLAAQNSGQYTYVDITTLGLDSR